MPEKLSLNIYTADNGVKTVRLELNDQYVQGGNGFLTPACDNINDFRDQINSLKQELDIVLEQADAEFLQADESRQEARTPEEIWEKMQSFASDREMFDFFNSLQPSAREEVAEYILTKVNMFKGKAPIFAEHLNHEHHLLHYEL